MNLKDIQKLQKIAQGGKRAKTTVDDLEVMAKLEALGQAPLTAADRAMVGKLAAEATKKQPVTKLSEALGNVGAEGKKLRVTQTDRTAAKYLGGAPFSMMQEVDPRYADIMATWGVKTPSAATNIINQSDPDIIWSTLIGAPTQHRSNELIFNKLYKEFQKSAKEGNLSPELRARFNAELEPLFGEGADILDPNFRKRINTFEERAAVGNLLLGKGIGGELRGGSIIPGKKIMDETTEPMLRDVETFSIGPRLFTLNKGVVSRPDIHPAFPEILQGEDLKQLFVPPPNEIALPTFNEEFRRRTGRKKPGYYDLTATPPGEPYPTQFVDDKYLTHLQKEGFAHGGAVKMANGGAPRKYVPPSQLFPLKTDQQPIGALQNIMNAAKDESTTLGDKGATMDIINRGPVADVLGGFVDLANIPLQGLDYLASKIPAFSKPASVMEPEGERVSIAPVSSDEPYGGSAAWKKQFQKSGVTSMTERPLTEMAASLASPFAPFAASKALKAGKALAPTAGKLAQEFAEKTQFGMPLEMNVVPPSQAVGKAAEVKAPANDLGLYSVVEKASLNLQRKSGNGDAFLSDLMKNQGVSQARLDETGLTAALKGRKGVTREEVQQLAAEGKIPLEERVAKEFTEEPKNFQEHRDNVDRVNNKLIYYGRSIDNLKEDLNKSVQMYGENNVNASQLRNKIKLMEEAYQQTYDELNKLNRVELEESAAKYGPKNSPNLNTKGGENYREILIKSPEKVAEPIDTSGWRVVTEDENKYSGQRVIKIYDENNNVVGQRSGYRGSDHDAIVNAAKTREKYETSEMNFGGSHHRDPNVLMHLRVADHVDSEGKRGLLIDELQSDWHQKGRDKGYGKKLVDMPHMSADELYDKHFNDLSLAQREYLEEFMKKWESAEYFGGDKELDKLINQYESWTNKQTIGQGVPDAPFKEDWYQLGLKRAIKEAVDTGMDRVYLTTGKTQADRYSLSTHIDDIHYLDNGDGTYKVLPRSKGAEFAISEINGVNLKSVPKDKLQDVVGKEVANKIIKGEGNISGRDSDFNSLMRLDNVDLQVGGEGMRQYYDKTYLNFLKKYAKQHGAEVGMTTLPSARKSRADLSGKEMHELMDNPEFKKILDEEFANDNNPNEKYAWNAALKRFGGQKVYYLDLNPALKNTAKKGQAFASGGAVQSPNDFDYESHVNNIMNAHNASNFDYEGHVNKIMRMAEGGAAYNTQPDMSDGGLSIPAAAFKIGGRIPLLTR